MIVTKDSWKVAAEKVKCKEKGDSSGTIPNTKGTGSDTSDGWLVCSTCQQQFTALKCYHVQMTA